MRGCDVVLQWEYALDHGVEPFHDCTTGASLENPCVAEMKLVTECPIGVELQSECSGESRLVNEHRAGAGTVESMRKGLVFVVEQGEVETVDV